MTAKNNMEGSSSDDAHIDDHGSTGSSSIAAEVAAGPLHVSSNGEQISETVPLSPPATKVSAEAVTPTKVTYDRIQFRQHETVLSVPQGGVSTVPSPALGRVTVYDDFDSINVDEYEKVRAPQRKKSYANGSKTTMMRGRKKRQSLEASRVQNIIKEDKADEDTGTAETVDKSPDEKKEKKPRQPPSPFREFLRRCSSPIVETKKRVSKILSSPFSNVEQKRNNTDDEDDISKPAS